MEDGERSWETRLRSDRSVPPVTRPYLWNVQPFLIEFRRGCRCGGCGWKDTQVSRFARYAGFVPVRSAQRLKDRVVYFTPILEIFVATEIRSGTLIGRSGRRHPARFRSMAHATAELPPCVTRAKLSHPIPTPMLTSVTTAAPVNQARRPSSNATIQLHMFPPPTTTANPAQRRNKLGRSRIAFFCPKCVGFVADD